MEQKSDVIARGKFKQGSPCKTRGTTIAIFSSRVPAVSKLARLCEGEVATKKTKHVPRPRGQADQSPSDGDGKADSSGYPEKREPTLLTPICDQRGVPTFR